MLHLFLCPAVACTSRRLNALATDPLWGALAAARLPRLVSLLETSAQQPDWWAGQGWRERLAALAAGASFSAAVYNRELGRYYGVQSGGG